MKRKTHVSVQINEARTPACAAACSAPPAPSFNMSSVRPSPPESVVRLAVVGGAVLKSPGGCGEDCGGGESEEGIGTPAGVCACEDASDIACASIIVRVVIDPLVVSSDCTDCDRIDGDGGVSSSSSCCCHEPCDPNE
jgi:hypothetical protein